MREGAGKAAIDLHACQALHAMAKNVSGDPRPRTDFKNARSKVDTLEDPRHDVVLDDAPPPLGPTQPSVNEVHDAPQSSVMLSVLPSGSLNHATLAPRGAVQIPRAS